MSSKRIDELEVARLMMALLTDKCLDEDSFKHLSPWQQKNVRKLMRQQLKEFGLRMVQVVHGLWTLST